MYKNVGKKIKNIGEIICWLGIIGGVIIALIGLASENSDAKFTGLISGAVIAVMSWLSNLCLVGYGQIIHNSDKMLKIMEQYTGITVKDEEEYAYEDDDRKADIKWTTTKDLSDRDLADIKNPESSTPAPSAKPYVKNAENMVFCRRCGKPNSAEYSFCTSCNSALDK